MDTAILIISASTLILFILSLISAPYYVKAFIKRAFEPMTQDIDLDMYLCSLLVKPHFDCEEEMVITDFSQYDSKGIVSMAIYSKQSAPPGHTKEEAEQPQIISNAVLYPNKEGLWQWEQI